MSCKRCAPSDSSRVSPNSTTLDVRDSVGGVRGDALPGLTSLVTGKPEVNFPIADEPQGKGADYVASALLIKKLRPDPDRFRYRLFRKSARALSCLVKRSRRNRPPALSNLACGWTMARPIASPTCSTRRWLGAKTSWRM